MISRKLLLSMFATGFAVFSALFLCPSSASAVNIDTAYGGAFQFNNNGRLYATDGSYLASSFGYFGGARGVKYSLTNFSISHVELGTDQSFYGGAVANFYLAIGLTEAQVTNPSFLTMIQPNNGDHLAILDVEEIPNAMSFFQVNYAPAPGDSNQMIPNTIHSYRTVVGYKITALVIKPTTDFRLVFSNYGGYPIFGDLIFIPGSYFTLRNEPPIDVESVRQEIAAGNDQAHKDSQAQLEESKKQTSVMEETKDFITDDSTPNASDIANSDTLPSVGLLPAGPLDSLLLLPLNIMNSIFSSLGGSCSPVVAPLPYVDQDVTFPCFGDTIYRGEFAPLGVLIGSVGSALILFYYFKRLYKKVDRATSLEITDEDEWGIL